MPSIRSVFPNRRARREARIRRLAETGERAPAVVTHVEPPDHPERPHPRVKVTYSVEPPDAPTFEVTKKVTVSLPAVPQPGDAALAIYAPGNPESDSEVLGGRPGDPASAYELEVALNRSMGLRDRQPALAPDAQHSAISPLANRAAVR